MAKLYCFVSNSRGKMLNFRLLWDESSGELFNERLQLIIEVFSSTKVKIFFRVFEARIQLIVRGLVSSEGGMVEWNGSLNCACRY